MSAIPEPRYLLLWKGRESGPFDFVTIREMLQSGEISRMHQVSFNGKWMVLDELLERQRLAPAEAPREAAAPRRSPLSRLLPPLELARSPAQTADDDDLEPEQAPRRTSGLAMAALVMGLCGFVPYLDLVTWIFALGFGHLALTQISRDPAMGGRWMAVTGLLITYFLLVMGLTFVILMVSNHRPLF